MIRPSFDDSQNENDFRRASKMTEEWPDTWEKVQELQRREDAARQIIARRIRGEE